jgi:hypothetical protein
VVDFALGLVQLARELQQEPAWHRSRGYGLVVAVEHHARRIDAAIAERAEVLAVSLDI